MLVRHEKRRSLLLISFGWAATSRNTAAAAAKLSPAQKPDRANPQSRKPARRRADIRCLPRRSIISAAETKSDSSMEHRGESAFDPLADTPARRGLRNCVR